MNVDAGMYLIVAGVSACVLFLLLLLFGKCRGAGRKTLDGTKLSLVVNQTEQGILLAKPDGTLEWANPAFTRITGYELADVSGKPVAEVLLGSLHSPKAAQQIKSGLGTRSSFSLEMLCARKDGHRYWFALHLSPMLDDRQRLVTFIGW